jgi:hypothetical protein
MTYRQNRHEDVDDVQIQVERREDILVRGQCVNVRTTHHHLRDSEC